MPTVRADFLGDVQAQMAAHLEYLGVSMDGIRADPSRSVVGYFNLRHRLVPRRPRHVLVSRELAHRAAADNDDRAVVERLAGEVRRGVDLRPRLSKSILDPLANDALLNDWAIHHLHVGETRDADDFVTRDGPLLFVIIARDVVYMVDRLAHGTQSFATPELVEIVHSNWPELYARARIAVAEPPEIALTPQERRKGRNVGVTTCIVTRDGTTYGPMGGGYVTSGLSVRVVMEADAFRANVRAAEKWAREQSDWIQSAIVDRVGEHIDDLELEFLLTNPPSIMERRTRVVVRVPFDASTTMPTLIHIRE